jgi:hypothetical protein
VNKLDAVTFFTMLCELMKTNPPTAADAPHVEEFAKIGIVPGKDFDTSKVKGDFVKRVPEIAVDRIMIQFKVNKAVKDENGWAFFSQGGVYGTDYLMRALVTAVGLGCNRPQDAIYPISQKDVDHRSYSGANKYIMHFPKGELPPAEGFWSLTMYDTDYFFVSNPIDRYSISARQNLKPNADGSVDLYIQSASPGKDKEANWLPAPSGDFILMMRSYWPSATDPSLLDGSWKVPIVMKVAA